MEKQLSDNKTELLNFVKSIYFEEIIENNQTIINSRELNIYLPNIGIAIELDNLIENSEINKEKDYHLQKTIDCEAKEIQLIQIFEDEWNNKKEIVKDWLRKLICSDVKNISAEQCWIGQPSSQEQRTFLNNNNLKGYVASSISYGLYCLSDGKEYLVALMSFGSLRRNLGNTQKEDDVYEMYRVAELKNFNIVGGASKLFNHFINQYKPKKIIAFADRRYSTNIKTNLYKSLEFKLEKNTEINYFYIDGTTRINRFALRKDILISKYGCLKETTEHAFCFAKGWYRIYDAGNLKYLLELC